MKGLNFFDVNEQTVLRTLARGEFNIHGLRRADLAQHLDLSPSALSRQLSRLRYLCLIKKVAHTYRYDLTRIGRAVIPKFDSSEPFFMILARYLRCKSTA